MNSKKTAEAEENLRILKEELRKQDATSRVAGAESLLTPISMTRLDPATPEETSTSAKYRRENVMALKKFSILIRRNAVNFSRELRVFIIFYIQGFFTVLLCSLMYSNLNRDYNEFTQESLTNIRNRIGSFFFLAVYYYVAYLGNGALKMEMESQVVYKEIGSGYYSPFTYFLAKSLIDLAFLLPPTLVQAPLVYMSDIVLPLFAHETKL